MVGRRRSEKKCPAASNPHREQDCPSAETSLPANALYCEAAAPTSHAAADLLHRHQADEEAAGEP